MYPKMFRRYFLIKRYGTIIDILIKYEYNYIVDQMGLRPFRSARARLKGYCELEDAPLKETARARKVLEELGPTYVKLGQLLSVRQDIIPPEYAQEFSKLQDSVPPFPFEDVKNLIEIELEAELDEIFKEFEHEPIAAASIGQVHCAKLMDGTEVVIKVQRPGIKKVIDTDIDMMYSLAEFLQEHIAQAKLYRPTEIVNEFSRSIHAEMDYAQEARNIDRFASNFRDNPHIYIPKVYWEYSTKKVLTMEYVKGISCTDPEEIDKRGFDREYIATESAKAFMKQVFEDGFFHADMHPGNVFIVDDERIALIDFGMVGHLPTEVRNSLVDALNDVISGDIPHYIEVLRDFDVINEETDVPALRIDIEYLVDKYYGRSFKQLDTPAMLGEMINTLRRHQARVPANVAIFFKGILTIEGFGAHLVPDFNVTEIAEPYVKKVVKDRVSPKNIAKGAYKDTMNLARTMHKLPMQVSHILTNAEKGYLTIKFENEGLDRILAEINVTSNRLAFSLILSSIIVGSSLIIQTGMAPLIAGVPMLGVIGFLTAGIMGMWLIIYILRTGHI